jgi:hypothetical protein
MCLHGAEAEDNVQCFARSRLRLCVQVDDDSTEEEIKAAYRQLAKVCHPDFAGDAGHNICILLNEVSRLLLEEQIVHNRHIARLRISKTNQV